MNGNEFYYKERYKRNIIIESIGLEKQQKLLEKKVLIAGAGGLGSGVIAGLVSAGVGTIGIIDSDKVELSNLNRQFIHRESSIRSLKVESAFEWIKNYSPKTSVNIHKTRINDDSDAAFFREYDLIIDCFDSYRSKFTLNKICMKKGLALIHGGVKEFYGQVLTIVPEKSSCLDCMFENPEFDTEKTIGIISPAVNVISSIQAMEGVKFLLGMEDLLIDTLLAYDGIKQEFRKISLKRRKDCISCGGF